MRDELLQRLDRLETRIRRLRRAVAVMLLLLAVLLLVAAAPGRGSAPLLRARGLHVVDRAGRVRLRLTAEGGQPALIMLDDKGRLRSVQCTAGWARYDAQGELYVQMGDLDCLPAEKGGR